MVKHSQKVRRQQPTHCLRVLDYFEGFALKGLRAIELRQKELSQSIPKRFSVEKLFSRQTGLVNLQADCSEQLLRTKMTPTRVFSSRCSQRFQNY